MARLKKPAWKNMVICICGMAGSGKSTVAKRIAEHYHLRYFSGGDALKALAMAAGHPNVERGWWESPEGLKFLEERSRYHEFDMEIDQKLLELASQGNVVLDSWTMPWLLEKGFKIWLEASATVRAKRIAGRDAMSLESAAKALGDKETCTKRIYEKLYGFKLGEDFRPFHLILDTDNLAAEEVFSVLRAAIDAYYVKN